jgi:isochorismate synthase
MTPDTLHFAQQASRELREARAALRPGERALLTWRVPGGYAAEIMDLELPGRQREAAPTRAVWAPEGSISVALGEARRFNAEGPARWTDLQKQLEVWFASFRKNKDNQSRPRVFGGGSFGQARDTRGPWVNFGDATFVAPALTYSEDASGATLSVVADPDHDVEARLRAVADLLSRSPERRGPRPEASPLGRPGRGDAAWAKLVEDATRAMGDGKLDKVVLARKVVLELSTVPRLSELLQRLAEQGPSAARFAFRLGGQTFLGASPERLVRLEGLKLQTEALAGTMPKGRAGAAARLLSSQKERFEHALVVQAILDAIGTVSRSVEVAETPELAELPNLFHLRTPITAELEAPSSILELVARLHPTPAVGGSPREAALQYIAQHEPSERGWYAAPLGWVDSSGDGEFIVALRSALLDGHTAHLYAGAGIVRDSDPELEFQETEVKLARMWTALGLRAFSEPESGLSASAFELDQRP